MTIILIDGEKAFAKIQYALMIKVTERIGGEGPYLNTVTAT